MIIGMFPDCDLKKVQYIGNAAGDGARIALINVERRKETNEIARKVEYVEFALEEDFNDRFGEAMQFPLSSIFRDIRLIAPELSTGQVPTSSL